MKILGNRREDEQTENMSGRRKVKVDILGRGSERISVSSNNTVDDLRTSLDVGGGVRAVDENGNILNGSDTLGKVEEVNFVPNVKGGKQ